MGRATNPESLVRIVRQHALTSRLLGVDFVPAYRAGAPDAAVPEPGTPIAELDEPRLIEVKPSTPPPAAEDLDALFAEAGVPAPPASPHPDTPELTREQAQAALDRLRARYEKNAPHAPFITKFTNIVFGEGDPRAAIMFVGEAPGEDEDLSGRPFVGRAGQLLDKMIVAMGLAREAVYICNVLKVRPPNNATPTLEETAASKPYLLEQIDIVCPRAIVTLGKSASQCLLEIGDSMGSMRGRWHQLRLPTGRAIAVMPTFHPAYLLRSYTAENRQKVWSDLKMVMERAGRPA